MLRSFRLAARCGGLHARCGGGHASLSPATVHGRETLFKMPSSRWVSVEAGELTKGDFFDFNGKRCVVLKTSQQINNRKLISENNRKAMAIVEFREIKAASKHKETFYSHEKFEKYERWSQNVTFLYADEVSDIVYFQDPVTFEQVEVPLSLVGRNMLAYMNDGQEAVVLKDENGEAMQFQAPSRVPCKVVGFDGKVATLENGRMISVPSFIKEGDVILVDPEEEKYLERA